MNHIKHLLFDFGNVLLNLDEHRTWQGLEEILDPKLCEDINEQVFFPFECGLISEDSFFNRLQRRSIKVFTLKFGMLCCLIYRNIEFIF